MFSSFFNTHKPLVTLPFRDLKSRSNFPLSDQIIEYNSVQTLFFLKAVSTNVHLALRACSYGGEPARLLGWPGRRDSFHLVFIWRNSPPACRDRNLTRAQNEAPAHCLETQRMSNSDSFVSVAAMECSYGKIFILPTEISPLHQWDLAKRPASLVICTDRQRAPAPVSGLTCLHMNRPLEYCKFIHR